MTTDPIGSVQALTASTQTPWGHYAPGNLVTIHAGTETGWIIDLDPLPNMIGQPHRIEVPHSSLTVWHNAIARASQPAPELEPDTHVTLPADVFAELYLSATIDAQIHADTTLGPATIDAIVARHDTRQAA